MRFTRGNSFKLLLALFFSYTFNALAADQLNVVYHVSEAEKVNFALGNIKNHIDGVGGPENVNIVLVVHGPALKAFHDIEATDQTRAMYSALQEQGVEFDACGNTMRAQDVELDGLLPGMVRVDQGGVVRIAELQAQGYLYIRP